MNEVNNTFLVPTNKCPLIHSPSVNVWVLRSSRYALSHGFAVLCGGLPKLRNVSPPPPQLRQKTTEKKENKKWQYFTKILKC